MNSYLMNDKGEMMQFVVHKDPVFKELKNKEWILWGYSDDYEDRHWNNRLPQYYDWLYNSSSKHRAIVNRKQLFINGKGLKSNDRGLNLEEQIDIRRFLFKLNDTEFTKRLALSLAKNGGFSYELIPDKAGKKITPHYINIANVRRDKITFDSKGRENPAKYFYTADWSSKKPEENPDFTEFYEWNWEEKIDSTKRYLVFYKEDEESIYPIPEYTAAIPYIAADYEVANFVYNNVKNGFSAGWLVNFFNGEPQEDQKEEIAALWKSRLHGSDNSGDPVMSFNDKDTPGVTIEPLSPNGQDDRFINLNKQIREEIFSGHTVQPILVGLEGNNGFNNNADEKRTAIEDFQNYYVEGKQQVIESHINAIRLFNGIKGEVFIQRLDPITEQLSEAALLQISTLDEMRSLAGLGESKTESNAVADALGTISPLVATKVLETMTAEEIRAIVGLQKTTEPQIVTREVVKEFSKEEADSIILAFLNHSGIDSEELEFLDSREIFAKDIEDAEAQEISFKHTFQTPLEESIIRILGGLGENPDVKTIADLLGKTQEETQSLLDSMKEQGLVDDNNNPIEDLDDEIFTVYKYEKRNDVSGGDVIEGTRDFCRRLVSMSRLKSWTLEDIKRMNNGMGLDVFRSRGGWYHNPNTGKNTPYCRHIWKQYLVRKKA